MKRMVALMALAGVVGLVGAGWSHGQSQTNPDLDALTAEFTTAFNAKDARRVASFFADDAVIMSPGEPITRGRASIEARYTREFAGGLTALRIRPMESAADTTLAFEAGTSSVALQTADGRFSASGKYVLIYKRVGREWKIAYDIYTSD